MNPETLDQFDDLVQNLTRGDLHAFDAFVIALGQPLLETARDIVGDHEGACDVLEEFLQGLLDGTVGRFRPSRGRALPWLHRVYCRLAFRHARRRERQRVRDALRAARRRCS